jgi:hypothetical protein
MGNGVIKENNTQMSAESEELENIPRVARSKSPRAGTVSGDSKSGECISYSIYNAMLSQTCYRIN